MNNLINKSELARKIGLSRNSFENKKNNTIFKGYVNKFSDEEKQKICKVLIELANVIRKDPLSVLFIYRDNA